MVADNPESVANLPPLSERQASRLISNLLQGIGDGGQDHEAASVPSRIDQYVIECPLGSGGGGSVFRAVREGSDRRVAVKLLHTPIDEHARAKRAWRELELLEQLHLPGFPHVYDYGLDGGRMFIVSDHVEGRPLHRHCEKNNLDVEDRVRLMIKVAERLQSLHEHGVIHRDLKPANILIDESGNPVIIDLGIAALVSDEAASTLTQPGAPIGSPAYMSPEQARGELERISTRSDVYGLAATACKVLTGKTPHDVDAPLHEAVRRVAQDPPRSPLALDPTLPRALSGVLERGLAVEPERRYPSASEFAADLQRWLDGEPIGWQRPGWLERQRMKFRRNPRAWWGQAVLWVLLALVVASTLAAIGLQSIASDRQELLLQEQALRQQAVEVAAAERELRIEREQFAQQQLELANQMQEEAQRFDELKDERLKEVADTFRRLVAMFEDDVTNNLIFDGVIESGIFTMLIDDLDVDDEELISRVADTIRELHRKIKAGELNQPPNDDQ